VLTVSNVNGQPIVVTTTTPHSLTAGQDVTIASVIGASIANGGWTVAGVISPTQFLIAVQDIGRLVRDGSTYTGSGTVTSGIFQAMMATNAYGTQLYDNGGGGSPTAVACQGCFLTNWVVSRSLARYGTSLMPLNVGFPTDGESDAGKVVIHAPYVALRISDEREAFLAGTLWDSHLALTNESWHQISSHESKLYRAFANHQVGFPLCNLTLRFKAQEDS
jgi:hypothetical protein